MGSVAFFSITTWILTGISTRTETSDKLTYLLSGTGALIFGLYFLKKKPPSGLQSLLNTVAIGSVLTGIAIVEHKAMSKEHPMGFGWGVFVVTLCLLPLLHSIMQKEKLNIWIKFLAWLPAAFAIFCDLLAFWQTRTTLIEPAHSEYVLNEIWSPAAGYNSYQTFVPQYTFLLGWLVKPILVSMGAINGSNFLVLMLTGFGFACIGLMIWLSRRAWPELPWPFLLLAVLSFCTPTPGWNRLSFIGPASTLLSGPALRIFGGMIVGAITISVSLKLLREKAPKWQLLMPGVASAFVVWNNLDFGLAATVASFLVFSAAGAVSQKGKLAFIWHIAGQLLGHLAIYIYLASQGAVPDWSLFGWFARQFGGGFGSVLIEMPGPVNLDFPLMMGTAATGFYFLLKHANKTEELIKNTRNNVSTLTAFYFGAFCTFALPYYVNRSYHSGQMSILYIPLSVALIAVVGLVKRNSPPGIEKKIVGYFPTLILAFMMATVLLIPNPSWELKRVQGGNPDGTFPRAPLVAALNMMPAAEKYAAANNLTIGFYGEDGNYVHALNGMKSANIFNSPLDMFQSDASVNLACKHLINSKLQLLVMTESARQSFAWSDGSLCDGVFVQENVPGVGILGIRKK
ncbi:MAG: hypothetical protein WCJ89_06240 [Actinomycetes bacterium]